MINWNCQIMSQPQDNKRNLKYDSMVCISLDECVGQVESLFLRRLSHEDIDGQKHPTKGPHTPTLRRSLVTS